MIIISTLFHFIKQMSLYIMLDLYISIFANIIIIYLIIYLYKHCLQDQLMIYNPPALTSSSNNITPSSSGHLLLSSKLSNFISNPQSNNSYQKIKSKHNLHNGSQVSVFKANLLDSKYSLLNNQLINQCQQQNIQSKQLNNLQLSPFRLSRKFTALQQKKLMPSNQDYYKIQQRYKSTPHINLGQKKKQFRINKDNSNQTIEKKKKVSKPPSLVLNLHSNQSIINQQQKKRIQLDVVPSVNPYQNEESVSENKQKSNSNLKKSINFIDYSNIKQKDDLLILKPQIIQMVQNSTYVKNKKNVIDIEQQKMQVQQQDEQFHIRKLPESIVLSPRNKQIQDLKIQNICKIIQKNQISEIKQPNCKPKQQSYHDIKEDLQKKIKNIELKKTKGHQINFKDCFQVNLNKNKKLNLIVKTINQKRYVQLQKIIGLQKQQILKYKQYQKQYQKQIHFLKNQLLQLNLRLKQKQKTINYLLSKIENQKTIIINQEPNSIYNINQIKPNNSGFMPTQINLQDHQYELTHTKIQKNSLKPQFLGSRVQNNSRDIVKISSQFIQSIYNKNNVKQSKNSLNYNNGVVYSILNRHRYESYLKLFNENPQLKKMMLKNKQLFYKDNETEIGYIVLPQYTKNSLRILIYIKNEINQLSNLNIKIINKSNLNIYFQGKSQNINNYSFSLKRLKQNVQIKPSLNVILDINKIPYYIPEIQIQYYNQSKQKKIHHFYLPCTFHKFIEFHQVYVDNVDIYFKTHMDMIIRSQQIIFNKKIIKNSNFESIYKSLKQYIGYLSIRQGDKKLVCGFRFHYYEYLLCIELQVVCINDFRQQQQVQQQKRIGKLVIQYWMASFEALICK